MEGHYNRPAYHHSTLSPQHFLENEPIDQFIQSGGDPSGFTPSEQDYFSLFAEFAMDLGPSSSKCAQPLAATPVTKVGFAPSTLLPPPKETPRKRKNEGTSGAVQTKSKKKADSQLADDFEDEGGGDSIPEREKRLLKNRKAAQQFRRRQKHHILELETRVETLSSENSSLNSQVELLRAENKLVREQLDYMRGFVLNALQFTFPPNLPVHELQKSLPSMPGLPRDLLPDKKDSPPSRT